MKPIVVPFEVNLPTKSMFQFCLFLAQTCKDAEVYLFPLWNTDAPKDRISRVDANTMLSYQLGDSYFPRNMLPRVKMLPMMDINGPLHEIPFSDIARRVTEDLQREASTICLISDVMMKMLRHSQQDMHQWWGAARKLNVNLMVAFWDSDEDAYHQMMVTLGTMRSMNISCLEVTDSSLLVSGLIPMSTDEILSGVKSSGYQKLQQLLGNRAYQYWFQLPPSK